MDHFSVPPQNGPFFSENTECLKATSLKPNIADEWDKKPWV